MVDFYKKHRVVLLDVFILFLLSLLPFNWLSGGKIITGHDSGAPLIPYQHFIDRLFVWTNRWGLSADQSNATGAFFIHGLEALFSALGFSLQKTEQLNYVFWLFLPAVCMYFFIREIFPTRRYLHLIASVFFMINHFLIQGWSITERTKFSVYAAMPLVLLVIVKMFKRHLSPIQAGILTAIVVGILNGGGNAPLYGSLLLLVPIVLLYFLFLHFSIEKFKEIAIYSIISLVLTFLLSLFWIVPYYSYVANNFNAEFSRIGGVEGVLGWASVISENTSFLNLMRLQGIPDWYQNPLHPYANVFLNSPLLIVISFIFPVLAFSAWYFAKEAKERVYVILFMFISLIGMAFAAGLHQPTGFIYELMIRYIPGFVVFRTPFYKFAPLIWMSYSILIGFTFDVLLKKIATNRLTMKLKLHVLVFPIIILGILAYNYPILDGIFFDYETNGRTMRLSIPQYIFDFQKWADGTDNKMKRSLLLPGLRHDNKLEVYNWKYFSLATLTTLLTRETFMINAFYNTLTEDIILNSLYENLLNNEDGWDKLAAVMGSQNFVVRGDFKWNEYGAPTRRPEEYEQTLKNSDLVFLNKVFGKWRIYSFKEGFVNPLITASDSISFAGAAPTSMRNLTSVSDFDHKKPIYFIDQNIKLNKDLSFFSSKSDTVYLIPNCISCDLRNPSIEEFTGRDPIMLPGSPIYFLVKNREKEIRKKANTIERKIDYALELSLRRLQEAKKMVDAKTNVNFIKEPILDHYLLMTELNSFLTDKNNFSTEEGNNLLIRIEAFLEHERGMLEYLFGNSPVNLEIEVNKSYLSLMDAYKTVHEWSWRTRNEQNKRYLITVTKPGMYDFMLQRNRLELPENQDPSNITFNFSIDGIKYTEKPESVGKTWILIKRIPLTTGIHSVNFEIQPLELFKGELDTKDNLPPPFVSLLDGVYTLKSQGEKNCVRFPVRNLVSGTTYRVNFKHRKLSGDQDLRVFVLQKDKEITPLTNSGDLLQGELYWRNFQSDLQLIESSNIIFIVCTEMYRDPIYVQDTNIEIRDISVRKISSPVLIFEKDDSNISISNPPQVTFDRINQTKYRVRITDAAKPYFLTFSQRFSPSWKVHVIESKKDDNSLFSAFTSETGYFSISNLFREKLSEDNHFISNTYANTWYIDKTGNYEIIVEYNGQLWFYVAAFTSVSVLISSIILSIVLKRKNK